MTRRACLCLSFLIPLLCAVAAAGQQASPALKDRPAEPPSSPAIQLSVVVSPQSGAPVPGLEQKDFTILVNKKPQAITSFRAMNGTQEPVEIILMIDSVNSTFQSVAQARPQIDNFLRANNGHLKYPTALATFSDKGIQIQNGFTADGNALAPTVDTFATGLHTIIRSMGLYGEVQRFQQSIQAFGQVVAYASTRPGRKIILWISSGWPLLGEAGVQLQGGQQAALFNQIVSISTMLRESDITIYSLNSLGSGEGLGETFHYQDFLKGVAKPNDAASGNLGLQVIATQSGGLVLNSRDISGLLDHCISDAGAYYQMSFEPPPVDRKNVYHRLEIKIARAGLIARTSSGYYSQP